MYVEALSPTIGAQVTEIDMAGPLCDGVVEELHGLLVERLVLVFPGQGLSPGALVDVGRALGILADPHPVYETLPDHPDVVRLEWSPEEPPDAAEWHSDLTFRPEPPAFSMLQAQIVPPVGGDTLWADMRAVLDRLPAGERSDLAGLSALHDMGAFRNGFLAEGGAPAADAALAEIGSAVHPVVGRHPVTGREHLEVNESFTRHLVGRSAVESQRLLERWRALVRLPEVQCRLRWRVGTLAIWDNRGSQHYAVDDYLPHRRVMHRVVVQHDRRASSAG